MSGAAVGAALMTEEGDGRMRLMEDEEEDNAGAGLGRRAVHAALTHATYAAAAPVLPLLGVRSAFGVAAALGAFVLPPLLLPVAVLANRRALRSALHAVAAVPPLLLALRVCPPLALAVAGTVALAQHASLVAARAHRRVLAMRLALLHSFIAAAAVLAPPLAAALFRFPTLPFFALALAHAVLVPFALRDDHKRVHAPQIAPSEASPALPSLREHPRLILVLIAMLASAATSSYLRPLLVPYMAPDNTLSSYMRPALLFSLHAVAAFLAETLVPPLLTNHITLRTAVSLGILTALTGVSLVHHSFITIGLFFMALGSSASLVLAVSDIAATTNQPLNSVTDPIAVLAARTFSCGEALGMFLAGVLAERSGFDFAILVWYRVMIVVALIVVVPHLVLRCCTPFAFLLATSASTSDLSHEQTPLLDNHTAQSSNYTFTTSV